MYLDNYQKMSYVFLRKFAYIYLTIPLLVFALGFLKWYWAVMVFFALTYIVYKAFKSQAKCIKKGKHLSITIPALIGVYIFMLVWTYFGGMNGYWYQTSDWGARNAVFRDLITHSWPVYYHGGSALVYYFGHWLPAAAIGKLIYILSNSLEAAWFVGRILLWIWSSMGLSIIALLLFFFLGAVQNRTKWMILLLFVFFSGMDIIGVFLGKKQSELLSPEVLHLEWWGPNSYQFSSITTCLYWAFNQAIVPWIITLLVMLDDDARFDIFYLSAGMICAPMPMVGVFILMAGKEASRLVFSIRKGNTKEWLRTIFTMNNLLMLTCCVPILAIYLLGSNAAGDVGYKVAEKESDSTFIQIAKYAVFIILDAGVLLFLLWPFYKHDVQFYVIGISLMIFPLIQVGTKSDFCMRASIPAIFTLMVYSMNILIHKKELLLHQKERTPRNRYRRLCIWALCLVLAIGAVTPVVEIYRGFYHVMKEKSILLSDDSVYSFETMPFEYNYTVINPKEHLFFRVFARDEITDK